MIYTYSIAILTILTICYPAFDFTYIHIVTIYIDTHTGVKFSLYTRLYLTYSQHVTYTIGYRPTCHLHDRLPANMSPTRSVTGQHVTYTMGYRATCHLNDGLPGNVPPIRSVTGQRAPSVTQNTKFEKSCEWMKYRGLQVGALAANFEYSLHNVCDHFLATN